MKIAVRSIWIKITSVSVCKRSGSHAARFVTVALQYKIPIVYLDRVVGGVCTTPKKVSYDLVTAFLL